MNDTQQGNVLLTLVVGILVLGVTGAAMLTIMTTATQSSVAFQENMQTFYLAESGLSVVRSGFNKGSSAQILANIDNLHHRGSILISGVGEVELAIYPAWFHTEDADWPEHGGGMLFPARLASTTFAAQEQNGSTRLLFGTDTPPPHADLYPVVPLDRPLSSVKTTAPARWTLTVSPLHTEVPMPPHDGILGLVDANGLISPDKRFQYRRLRVLDGVSIFEELRPLGHTDDDPLPADRFLLHPSDLTDKDLVLGQYATVDVVARTHNYGKTRRSFGITGNSSFRPVLLDPEAAFPGIPAPTLGGAGSLSGNTESDVQESFDTLFTGTLQGTRTFHAEAGIETRVLGFLRETFPAAKNHFLKRDTSGFTPDFWAAALTDAGTIATADPLLLHVRLNATLPGATRNRFCGLLFRTAFVNDADLDAGVIGLGLGVMDGSLELETASVAGNSGFTVIPQEGTTVNPLFLPGFVTLPADSPAQATVFFISEADWNRYSALYLDASATPGRKRLKPLLTVWAYNDSPGTQIALTWLAVSVQPLPVPADSGTIRLFAQVREQDNENHIRAWFASGKASSPVHWQYINEKHARPGNASVSPEFPPVVATSFATGTDFSRTGLFQGAYRTNGTPPDTAPFAFSDFSVGLR